MICRFAASSVVCLLMLTGCGSSSPLPAGGELGPFADIGDPESYTSSGLYTYMDGGADIFLEYGSLALSVRRYSQGASQMTVELFEMRDRAAAAALYSYMRRPGSEADLMPGCRASMTAGEILLARGKYYLACRNDDPMANQSNAVRDLTRRIAGRLVGECGLESVFSPIRAAHPVPGTEVSICGPIGLGVRPWVAPLQRKGFERGWLASYRTASGLVEALLAEYQTPEFAAASVTELSTTPHKGVKALNRGRRVVILQSPAPVAPPELSALADSLLAR